MAPILIVFWLIVVVPCAIFAGGFAVALGLDAAMRRLAGSDIPSEQS